MDWVQVLTIILTVGGIVTGIVIAFNNQTNKRIDDLRLSVNDKIDSLEKRIMDRFDQLDTPKSKSPIG